MEASRGILPSPSWDLSDKGGRGAGGQRELAAYFAPVPDAFPLVTLPYFAYLNL